MMMATSLTMDSSLSPSGMLMSWGLTPMMIFRIGFSLLALACIYIAVKELVSLIRSTKG